ncbi:hypothetical protein F3Y22_tig00112857pilonHSYRG00225 [Hibiscus syriacus]|uniref:Uncharacterized protein n=1 Tax=Hibiscus syriacus TaxID=106335 RepID=A0A6A2X9X1_HIBSY|nr:hypothetical protein F3Y22_tig00112857pilonHSYRG00225 [Hibiscus syriacus]
MAARDIPTNDDQMKHPEFLNTTEACSFLALGECCCHLFSNITIHTPQAVAVSGSPSGGNSQIPGGDETFVPNPGFEAPIPGGHGGARH